MYLFHRSIAFIYIVLMTLLSVHGQSELRFKNYYIEDGLPHSRARDIIQDSVGWIWIGTTGGLSRFDGISFKNYQLSCSEDPESLSSIRCFWEDNQSRLWIGTEGDGLVLYDRELDRFEHFIHHDTLRNCISSNQVNSITSDAEGILWIATDRGVNRFDPASRSFRWILRDGTTSSSIVSDSVNKVFIDRNNKLWIGTVRGLNFMNPETGQISGFDLFTYAQLDPLPGKNVEDISQDKNGNILIATYYGGLFVIDPTLSHVMNILPDPEYMRSYLVRSIYPDRNGELWLGTRGGLYILDQEFQVLNHYEKMLQDETSLSHTSVHDIYKDKTGNFWIATRGGLSYANIQSIPFKYYGASTVSGKYLNDPEVYSITQSTDGKIWIGTEAGGINILDLNTHRMSYLVHDENNPNSVSVNNIKAIHQDRAGNFWIGTFLGGLDYYDVKKNIFIHYKHDPGNSNSLINNNVWTIHEDSPGSIWIGTDMGVQRLEPKSQVFTTYRKGLNNHPVHIIYEDHSGNLYFGSDFNELMVLTADSQQLEFEIPARVIHEDSKGRIWIGSESNNGLIQFDCSKGIINQYRMADGPPSNQIYGILEDQNGLLWLGTGKGLSSFNPETKEFNNYRVEDGIQGDRFYYGAYCKCQSGDLMFGGQNGLTIFDPDKLSKNHHIPPIQLTALNILNREVPVGREFMGEVVLNKSISASEEIVLKHNHSVLTIEYVALNYVNSASNEYAYMLEGFEDKWNYVGSNRSATYTNLDPGDYIFRVKGANSSGVWNEAGASLGITVAPSFYQTLFFKLLIAGVVVLTTYLIIIFFIRREKLKNELVMERTRSNELHKIDLMKFQFFTNISHEIRTPISLIVSPLSRIKNAQLSKDQILKDIDVVHRNALRLGKLVDQLLDYRKLEAGKLKLELSRGNIVTFLENVLFMFKEMSDEKEIELKFHSALDHIQIYFDADKVEKVMFNLLSNSFKHTPPGGTVHVTTSLTYLVNEDLEDERSGKSGEYIQIVVRDTGSGIEESKIEHIFDRFYQGKTLEQKAVYGSGIGLSLSRELIKVHNGRIRLKSQVGIGTEVTVLIPVIRDDPKQAVPADRSDWTEKQKVIPSHGIDPTSLEQLAHSEKPVLLILEDNKELLGFIQSIFEEECMVLVAEDGEAGLELAMKTIPDLVIADVLMPKMDGIKFCKKLKQDFRTSHVPVIMLSALSSRRHEKEGILGGADEYITKPFDPSVLKIRVDQLLATRRLLREKYSRESIAATPVPASQSTPDDKFLAKLVGVIEENISDPEFGTMKISKEVGVSRTQLYRKMAALTEMTVKEFIRSIRLKRAAQLISIDQVSISEAAYAVGFQQVAYFRKCFKEMFGMTPSEYAKRNTVSGVTR
jgi:ligand-binding sensor domain-containing protein/signal transduction histidine kinase/DNA-binding response OmpR family regulator